ncbi:hypothetical protein [Soonwooa sp.]|nr:hypothetical protein [Soonwooa sp.]
MKTLFLLCTIFAFTNVTAQKVTVSTSENDASIIVNGQLVGPELIF